MSAKLDKAAQIHKDGDIEGAIALYQQVLKQEPRQPKALNLLGVAVSQKNNHLQAIALMSQSIALQPQQAEFHNNIGAVYGILGNFEEAGHHYRRAVQLQPDYAEAYFNLASTKRFTEDDPVIPALEAQLSRVSSHSVRDRCFLHFAAGKIYEDIDQSDRAFEHYQQGNEMRGAHYDKQQQDQLIERMITVCDRAFLHTRVGKGEPSNRPIFIVGMPRSGTTLVEQILTQHSDVVGLGELPDIPSIAQTLPNHAPTASTYPECLSELDNKVFAGFGRSYLKRITKLAPGAKRTVDKLPGNFLHLGLIALMFPNATIIHCRRHPLDTCLSCYFKKFRSGHQYSFHLEDLGHYYLAYQRLMEHWHQVLPIPIFDLEYEALVHNQEQVTQDLLNFCGLTWEERCLAFHQSTQPVSTASNWQVRQPIYKTAVHRWQKYQSYLTPLIAMLGK
jgi:tetratricopeptide (TPR) repeat protein